MYSIAFIVLYFGKLPQYFSKWLKSCEQNKDVNWFLFTDNTQGKYLCPQNVKWNIIKFNELKQRIQSNFDFNICLEKPYKLCDFKPAFGKIFEEELKNFQFWGYCDIDQIFGDIRQFITNDILSKYDKIGSEGHLTLFKNNVRNNTLFMEKGNLNYETVFSSKNICVFDERMGIQVQADNLYLKTYNLTSIADISNGRYQYQLCYYLKRYPKTKKVLFFYESGKVFGSFYKDHKEQIYEFCYIHFSKRNPPNLIKNNVNNFYICNKGFIEKKQKITKNDYAIYNNYSILKEIKVWLNGKWWKFKRKIKNYYNK